MSTNAPFAAKQTPSNRVGIPDPLSWLENKDDAATQAHIQAEKSYTAEFLAPLQTTIDALFTEIKNRIQLDDSSVPYSLGKYDYFTHSTPDNEYIIHLRRDKANHEIVLLDENALAVNHNFFDLGALETSPNEQLMAYLIDTTGDERYHLFIKDLTTNKVTDTGITDLNTELAWATTNAHLYLITLNDEHRPFQCIRYHLETHQQEILFEDDDDMFYVGVSLSKSEAYILLQSESKKTSEVHYLKANDAQAPFTLFQARQQNVRYYVDHHHDDFYILSNHDGINFSLWRTAVTTTAHSAWQNILPSRSHITLEDMEVFKDYLVITERHDAQLKFNVIDIHNVNHKNLIEFDESFYQIESTDNFLIESNTLRFQFESLHIPESIYDFDLRTQQKTLLKQQKVLGDFASENYVCERLFAKSQDDVAIPISLIYHRDHAPHTSRPLYLYGYGAYGISLDPWFSHARLSLLNRGISFAIAHIRGGGDCGENWHEQGKLEFKQNSFTDFAAVAKALVEKKYTSPEQLIIGGGSAGGLLMGAVLNQNPGLCKIAIAHVPFVDVLNTMLKPELPLTITEYEEWGDPNEPIVYERIASYSPYENVKTQHYPHMYVSCGIHDMRVPYWEALKWTQAIREQATNHPNIILHINEEAGHGGSSGRFQAMKEIAEEYAVIFKWIFDA